MINNYDVCNQNINQRETITLIIGSILLSSSFAIIGQYLISKNGSLTYSSFLSIGLYAFWVLILHSTTRVYEKEAYERLNVLELTLKELLGYEYGISNRLNKARHDNWYMKIRTCFWQLLLLFLSGTWLIISLQSG